MTARKTGGCKGAPIERFFRHVCEQDGCLIWTSSKAGIPGHEYGYFHPGQGAKNKVVAHRWIWEYINGPVPDGMQLDHVKTRGCTSKLCVKISHLEIVTPAENHERKRLEICRAGKHDLTDPVNQSWDTQGRRRGCAACRREREAARQRAKPKGQ